MAGISDRSESSDYIHLGGISDIIDISVADVYGGIKPPPDALLMVPPPPSVVTGKVISIAQDDRWTKATIKVYDMRTGTTRTEIVQTTSDFFSSWLELSQDCFCRVQVVINNARIIESLKPLR